MMSAATDYARAACPPPPVLQGSGFYIGRVTPMGQFGLNSSIAVDSQGRFGIAYETPEVFVGSDQMTNSIVAMPLPEVFAALRLKGSDCVKVGPTAKEAVALPPGATLLLRANR